MARYPNIGPKHHLEPHFVPSDISVNGVVPKKVIFLFSRHLYRYLKAAMPLIQFKTDIGAMGAIKIKMYCTKDRKLLVANMPLGSAIIAGTMEMLIGAGAREFIILGSAGAISPKLDVGDVVICTKALRDEGVSHHYLKPGKYVSSDASLTKRLESFKGAGRVFRGATWSIDAFFAETKEEIRTYMKERIMTVEMEAAAAFAVAQKRGVKASAVFAVSDLLYKNTWTGIMEGKKIGYQKLIKFALFFKEH
jgi:uridine phosphorylase